MSTIVWPGFQTGAVDYGVEFDVQISTMRNGRVYTYGLPGARWTVSIAFENELETMQRPAIEAFIVSLEGGANRLQLHHLGRPYPNGTLRGSPTLSAAVAAGAKSLPMNNCNGTLKKGDIIGLPNNQFVMVMADATPSFSAMTVSVNPAIRDSYSIATAVTWSKPTALWIPRTATAGPFPYRANGVRPGFSVDFVEA